MELEEEEVLTHRRSIILKYLRRFLAREDCWYHNSTIQKVINTDSLEFLRHEEREWDISIIDFISDVPPCLLPILIFSILTFDV